MKRCRYKFTLLDVAKAFGLSYRGLIYWKNKKKFNPNDIKSICEFYHSRKKKEELKDKIIT